MIREATKNDINAVAEIYEAILKIDESLDEKQIGWIRGIYPTEQTAMEAMKNNTLFVYEDDGRIVAAARIDQVQGPEYTDSKWGYDASDDEVMVLHTLVVDPAGSRRGYGKKFVEFYEKYALKHGCRYLRMDTNAKNVVARNMYKKLGYKEACIVPCSFNGIPDVRLVCLEKKL